MATRIMIIVIKITIIQIMLFVLSMVPWSLILKKVNAIYEWGKKKYKRNHLFFRDEKEQIDTLMKTAHVFSTDIGIEFGMKRCRILMLKGGKVVRCERIKLPNS